MTRIVELIDDATRSRLANAARKAGGGTMTLYAVHNDREFDVVMLVVATCAENALVLLQQTGLTDWTLANTTTRRIQKNIDAEPAVVTGFRIAHPRR